MALADAGYWHHEQMDNVAAGGIQVLTPPDAGKAKERPARLARRPLRVDAHGALSGQ